MTDQRFPRLRRPALLPVVRSIGGKRRPLLALLALLMPVMAITTHAASPAPAGALSVSRQVTPAGSPVAGTPAATPTASSGSRCSTVLGIGEASDACVAFVNAVPGSDPVNFSTVDGGDVFVEALGSGEFADFVAVSSEADLAFDVTAGDAVLATETVRLAAGSAAVIVLEQRYDGVGPTLAAAPLDLAPLSPGQARVAFHHAVTDAADLAVLGLPAPSDEAILPGETTDPTTLDAGPATVEVVPANAPEAVLGTLELALETDLSYLIIVGGTTGDQTVEAIYAAAPVTST